MKAIVFLIDDMYGGGAQELLMTYLEHSELKNVRKVLIQLTPKVTFPDRLARLDVEHYIVNDSDHSFLGKLNPKCFVKLYKLVKKIKPDCIYIQLFLSYFLGAIIARLSGVKKVIYALDYQAKQAPYFWPLFLKTTSFLVSNYLIYHESTGRNFALMEKKCLKYNLCISFEQFLYKMNESLIEPNTIVSAGRLVKDKDFDLLVRAFVKVKKRVPSATLMIAGEGPYKYKLEELIAKLDLKDSIKFVGYVNDIAAFYERAELLVQPSLIEVTNVASRIALARGKPVVKYYNPYSADVVDLEGMECGLYARHGSIIDLAEKIVSVLENKELWRTRRLNMQKHIKTLFNPNDNAEKNDQIILNLLNKHEG